MLFYTSEFNTGQESSRALKRQKLLEKKNWPQRPSWNISDFNNRIPKSQIGRMALEIFVIRAGLYRPGGGWMLKSREDWARHRPLLQMLRSRDTTAGRNQPLTVPVKCTHQSSLLWPAGYRYRRIPSIIWSAGSSFTKRSSRKQNSPFLFRINCQSY